MRGAEVEGDCVHHLRALQCFFSLVTGAMGGKRTANCAAVCNAMIAYGVATSRWTTRVGGKIGSSACFTSYVTKMAPRKRDPAERLITMGCDQGRFCPPRLRAPSRETIVIASINAPAKSIRRSFEGSPFAGAGGLEDGSLRATRMIARRIIGPWPMKDHLQPTVSARRPPRGPPMLRPTVATTLT